MCMKLLEELKDTEKVILKIKGTSVKKSIIDYLKQYYNITSEEFEIYINDISGIYDLDIRFKDDDLNVFLEDEALYGSELISNALDFSLGLKNNHCAVFPESLNNTEHVLIEVPKSIIC